jgi:hypothetical protein
VFDNCDKTGGEIFEKISCSMAKKYETLTRIDLGFIGSLYLNGQDVAELLIAEGLARLDEYASPSKALIEAEAIAKASRKNVSCPLSTPLDGLALINCALISPSLDMENLRC